MVVTTQNEVELYGTRFPIWGTVRQVVLTPFPGKITIGDYQRGDKTTTSEWVIADLSGGLGMQFQKLPQGHDRYWFGNLETKFQRGITLGQQVYQATIDPAPPSEFRLFTWYAGEIYAAASNSLYRGGGGENGAVTFVQVSSVETGGALGADSDITALVTLFNRLLVTTAESTYVYDATLGDWVRFANFGAVGAAYWDNKVFLLRSDGSLVWLLPDDFPFDPSGSGRDSQAGIDPAAVEPAGTFPLPVSSFKEFVTYYDMQGEMSLYAVTDRGLYLYDFPMAQFVATPVTWPVSDQVGRVAVWRGELFIPVGQALYRWNVDLVQESGPSKDDGLPPEFRGPISAVVPGHGLLYILTAYGEIGESVGYPDFNFHLGAEWFNTRYFNLAPGRASGIVMASPGTSWHGLWAGDVETGTPGGGIAASVAGKYRLYFSVGPSVYYTDAPTVLHNPLQRPDVTYQPNGFLVTPWFDAGWPELRKLALGLQVDADGCSETEQITIEAGWDGSDDWEVIATISENGMQEIPIPYEGGKIFRLCRLRVSMVRGGDETKSPVLRSLTLLFLRRPELSYGWEFVVTTHEPYKGITPLEMERRLLEIASEPGAGKLVFRDSEGREIERRVVVSQVMAAYGTKGDARGRWTVSVVEV